MLCFMKLLLIAFFSLLPCLSYGKLYLNEVMQSNVDGIMDDLNDFPDSWVEIYNDSDSDVNFTNYAIGLTSHREHAYPIFVASSIPAKGHLLIYCDKVCQGLHSNFRLNADGCTVFLFDASGSVIDTVAVPKMLAPNVAYGRVTDGDVLFSFFRKATPGCANVGCVTDKVLKKPEFSVKGGLYEAPIVLRLSLQGECPLDAVVRYTTNGSEPTESSPIAPDSIYIDKTTVVRAKSFSDSALSKVSRTESYIMLGRDVTLPVVSIVTDSSYLWDDKIGVYTEGTYSAEMPNYRFNWHRPANIECFDDNAVQVINQLGEIRLAGNDTRKYDVKSLALYANKRFGKKKFSHRFWSSKNIEEVKSFVLRNAGQDNRMCCMRDALVNFAAGRSMDVDWAACQPVIMLLNGQYFGVMNLRERTNEDFVAHNYSDIDNFDMLFQRHGSNNEVMAGDLDAWFQLDSLFSEPSTRYSKIAERIDVDEFCNMVVVNSLFCNFDFPGNNTVLWRNKQDSGKWRWLLKDIDWSLGMYMPHDFAYLNYLTRTSPFEDRTNLGTFTNPEEACSRYRKMFSYPVFQNKYIDAASVSMGTFFSLDNMLPLVDSMASLIESEMPYTEPLQFRLFTHGWNYNLGLMKSWYVNRVPSFYWHIANFFSLGAPIPVEIHSESGIQLYFNGMKLENNHFKGCYFKGRRLYLSRDASAFSYNEDGPFIDAADSSSFYTSNVWYVEYKKGKETVRRQYHKDALCFTIPADAESVFIIDNVDVDCSMYNNGELVIYPNPATDYVAVSGVEYGDELILTDLVGRRIKSFFVTEKPTVVNLKGLAKGLYLIKHSDRCFKVIKE